MAQKTIEVHYHPAMKEVRFKNEAGKPFEPPQLAKWQHEKFVLQEHGADFFDSIVQAQDNVEKIALNFYGTQIDWEDFSEMVRFYNEEKGEQKFTATQSGVLLGMRELYQEAEAFGNRALELLCRNLTVLEEVQGGDSSKEEFQADLKGNLDLIAAKMQGLSSAGLNLCFVGAYSAGKSSLINAILGEKILPEADETKTAKFFVLEEPSPQEGLGIRFDLAGDETRIAWTGSCLELIDREGLQAGSHPFRTEIEARIQANREESRARQFYGIIDLLNDRQEVGIKVHLRYPIPINSPAMAFTIYDTPGTGGNTDQHIAVLDEAIREQSHSIVIFVGGVSKLEGEGNHQLLKLLSGEGKNSIDLDRSLYVINRADTTTTSKLGQYHQESIRLRDSADVQAAGQGRTQQPAQSISLGDKKLFFTTASQGYAAKAMQAGVVDADIQEVWETRKSHAYFEFNRYGHSEVATRRTKETARAAAEQADEFERAYIDAGLFSLIEAIREYGQKYAMATKVNSLVATVEEVLVSLRESAHAQQAACDAKRASLQRDLDAIEGSIAQAVEGAYDAHLPEQQEGRWVLSDAQKGSLGMDPVSLDHAVEKVSQAMELVLRWMQNDKGMKWGKKRDDIFYQIRTIQALRKPLRKEMPLKRVDQDTLTRALAEALRECVKGFNETQKAVLTKHYREFKLEVFDVIKQSGDLTPEAKQYLVQGLESENFAPGTITLFAPHLDDVVEQCIKTKGKWLFEHKMVQTHELLKELGYLAHSVMSENSQGFADCFSENLQAVMDLVKETFEENAARYSVRVQEIKASQAEILGFATQLDTTSAELSELVKDLEAVVWKEALHA